MPMIDVYAAAGLSATSTRSPVTWHGTLMTIEQVPDIPMFRQNTAAFVHELPADSLSNVDGDSTYVRVQVLTNAAALDRDKQLAVVQPVDRPSRGGRGRAIPLTQRTWVLLTAALLTGAGDLPGHTNTNAELVAAARAQLVQLASEG